MASLVAPFVSDVRVADSEMWAMPAAWYVLLDAATAPEVDGPMTATTDLSATYFCASVCAGAGPCSTGVSPVTRLILRPYFGCSFPRKPAPPVNGATMAIFSLPLQLRAWDWATVVEPAPAVDASAAATVTANASRIPPRRFIPIFLLDGVHGV